MMVGANAMTAINNMRNADFDATLFLIGCTVALAAVGLFIAVSSICRRINK